MYLLLLGIVLVLLKYLQMGPVATWPWWWVLSPFGLTVLWWAWADATGYTKRQVMDKMDQRKQDRIDKQKSALGLGAHKKR
ncbi:TIGR04438 family Trp-rich protein [Simplicispira psychrophila]|uniref:TIGR04438 family Trp-rich protein n=1 Tax=Simplicispira psychrophila TaxID=80882 RepID=UPI000483BF6D|nr:TIGR04438 family Trp-rich protein [Simplicispira psychrophila]